MINELQILVEVEKALKRIKQNNFDKNDIIKYLENIRELQLQSFVENEVYNFVLSDAIQKKENDKKTFNSCSYSYNK